MPETPALHIEELDVRFGPVPALTEVSLQVDPGTICAVLGANGAGKTTLLRTVSGLNRPTRGRINLNGTDLSAVPAENVVRHGVAHVPEGAGIIGELTVVENLRLGALWRGDRAALTRSLKRTYELFPVLQDRSTQPASNLSGGERQMLAIGRALMAEPQLLLLDEPSLGLAPLVTRQIMQLIRDLRTERGLTVLIVEQNANSALSIADHGVVLSGGRVALRNTAEQLLGDDQTRHAYLGF